MSNKNSESTPKKEETIEQASAPVNIETTTIEEAKEVPVSDTKSTIIKCAALVAGAALVIYSFSSCLGKISDANGKIKETYENSSASVQVNGVADAAGDIFSDITDDGGEDAQSPADSTANTFDTADTSSDSSSSQADETPSSQGKPADKADSASKKPTTKEEVVAYFNASINKVKPNAKSVTQTKENNYQAGGIDLGSLGAFESVVNKLITSNMGENKEKTGITATSAADKNKIFPVENETWASKLTPADVKEAKCAESGGVYTIGLKIVDDGLNEKTVHGASHNGKVMSIVQTQSIYDNAGAASSLLKGLKIGYKNGTVVAKIDKATGNVLSVTYDFTWILHVDVFGGINAPFGITQAFEVKW